MLLREKIEHFFMFLAHPCFQNILLLFLLILYWIHEAFMALIGLVEGAWLLPQVQLMPAKPCLD